MPTITGIAPGIVELVHMTSHENMGYIGNQTPSQCMHAGNKTCMQICKTIYKHCNLSIL